MQQNLPDPSKTWLQRHIERSHGKPIDALLRELYVDRELTIRDVGAELHVHPAAVSRWLRDLGIPTRPAGRPKEAA